MFESTLLQSSSRRAAIPVGYLIDGALLALLVVYPLFHTQALPKAVAGGIVWVPSPPAAPHAPSRAPRSAGPTAYALLTAPVVIPNVIPRAPAPTEPAQAAVLSPGVLRGDAGVPGGLWTGMGDAAGVAPPPRPAKNPVPTAIRVGGTVEAAKLIFQIEPQYPAIAQASHIQGTVRLEAVISPSGTIESLHAVSGPPMLINAALGAVARWRYQPTLLNGEPVAVATEIDVIFTLGN